MVRTLILALVFIGAVLAEVASAVSVNLSPTADAPIKQFMVDTNFQNAALSSRSATNNEQRTVMQFDLSSIPAGVFVTSATLNLYGHAILGSTDVTNLFLFRIPRDWLENEVTYRQARNFIDWSNLGGDFVGTTGVQDSLPFATWSGPQSGATNAWYSIDATTLVQRWHAGVHANNGLLLRGSTGNELEFASSEDPVAANRPYLQINYVVPEPASFVLLALAVLVLFGTTRNIFRWFRYSISSPMAVMSTASARGETREARESAPVS